MRSETGVFLLTFVVGIGAVAGFMIYRTQSIVPMQPMPVSQPPKPEEAATAVAPVSPVTWDQVRQSENDRNPPVSAPPDTSARDAAAQAERDRRTAEALNQRLALERARDLREIRDAQQDLSLAQQTIPGGPGGGFASAKADIIKAKQSSLTDMITRYRGKYGTFP
jgi:hypothetical protein